jgi:hypothetical protein
MDLATTMTLTDLQKTQEADLQVVSQKTAKDNAKIALDVANVLVNKT